VTAQRLHTQLAPIDVLTREELSAEMSTHMDAFVRDLYRGLEIQRFPPLIQTATATTVNLGQNTNGGTPASQSISVGASPFTFTNVNPVPELVTVTGGTVSQITVNGVNTGLTSGTFTLPSAGSTITVTYTVAPTMSFIIESQAITGDPPIGPESGDLWMVRRVNVKSFTLADAAKYILFRGTTPSDLTQYTGKQLLEGFAASAGGQQVGVGFYPGTKSIFLQPNEQIYALITAATVGNQYLLEGEAIRVPAEMKGKIL
jgi:hypothetical protein